MKKEKLKKDITVEPISEEDIEDIKSTKDLEELDDSVEDLEEEML